MEDIEGCAAHVAPYLEGVGHLLDEGYALTDHLQLLDLSDA